MRDQQNLCSFRFGAPRLASQVGSDIHTYIHRHGVLPSLSRRIASSCAELAPGGRGGRDARKRFTCNVSMFANNLRCVWVALGKASNSSDRVVWGAVRTGCSTNEWIATLRCLQWLLRGFDHNSEHRRAELLCAQFQVSDPQVQGTV